MDPAVQQICVDTQNCRRQKLLEAIGSEEITGRSESDGTHIHPRLLIK